MTRLNNKKTGSIVMVMQRLHMEDLSGHVLAKTAHKWQHICLPAIAEKNEVYYFEGRRFRRKAGDLLHPAREGKLEIDRAREDLGSHGFASQYQQQPVADGQSMVQSGWFDRYDNAPEEGRVVQSWDTAIKNGANNDFSVCTVWRECGRGYFLLDVFCERLQYPDLKRNCIAMADKWQPEVILIEDKASGQVLLQDLRCETKLPVISIIPHEDKISRFAAITGMIEAGRVFLPKRAIWLADFERQILAFPTAVHDDMVDSLTQFLHWARRRGLVGQPRVRVV